MSDTPLAPTSPRRKTTALVKSLIDANAYIQVRAIAMALDLSTQRIFQITKALGLRQDELGKWVQAEKKPA